MSAKATFVKAERPPRQRRLRSRGLRRKFPSRLGRTRRRRRFRGLRRKFPSRSRSRSNRFFDNTRPHDRMLAARRGAPRRRSWRFTTPERSPACWRTARMKAAPIETRGLKLKSRGRPGPAARRAEWAAEFPSGMDRRFPEQVPGGERHGRRKATFQGPQEGQFPEQVPERHGPQVVGYPGRERRGRQGGDLQGDHSTPDQVSKLTSTGVRVPRRSLRRSRAARAATCRTFPSEAAIKNEPSEAAFQQ